MSHNVRRPESLALLIARIERLRPDSPRRWGTLTPATPQFPGRARDWVRWAWRHADHHLRQFGL